MSLPDYKDPFNPDYYTKGIETREYCHSHELNYAESSVIKYVTRHKMKGGLKDLKKALNHLTYLVENYERLYNKNNNV